MSIIVVDVESDGPIPGKDHFSMVCLGAVLLDEKLDKTFYGQMRPISDKWDPEALAISGFTREQHLTFPDPQLTMQQFATWIQVNSIKHPVFIADNPAYDFAWVNWYFHAFYGSNPFGYSGRRIADLWCGMQKDMHAKWKHLRQTRHSHNPVDDARGNAEALLEMQRLGLNFDRKAKAASSTSIAAGIASPG